MGWDSETIITGTRNSSKIPGDIPAHLLVSFSVVCSSFFSLGRLALRAALWSRQSLRPLTSPKYRSSLRARLCLSLSLLGPLNSKFSERGPRPGLYPLPTPSLTSCGPGCGAVSVQECGCISARGSRPG